MRFDPTRGRTAADLLADATEAELARILFEYGEERHARRIAKRIVERRRRSPLTITADLVEAVKAGVPRAAWSRRTHVATRTFQALRMAVNEEPEALLQALDEAPALLERGGRLGVISFHSGEDRAVKRRLPGARGPRLRRARALTRGAVGRRDQRQPAGPERQAPRARDGWRRHEDLAATRYRSRCRWGSGRASTADQQVAHFHRDSDRRRLRAMLVGVAAAGVVVALVLGLVGLRMQQVRLSYRLDILRTTKAGVEELNRRLRVEKASLQSLARIELEARSRLGMVAPTRQQVQLAREFAGAGTASTALAERTAAAAAPVREPVRESSRASSRMSASMKRGEAAPPP